MIPKKNKGGVYGAILTVAERKAIEVEIRRQFADYIREHLVEFDSIILWALHEQLKFGPDRMKKFYDAFVPMVDNMLDNYEMGNDDRDWLFKTKLKEYGVDIEEWQKKTE